MMVEVSCPHIQDYVAIVEPSRVCPVVANRANRSVER
jgi:hypothetical protein